MFKKTNKGYIYLSDNKCFDKATLSICNDNKWILKLYNDNSVLLMLRFPNTMDSADAIKRASEYLNNYIPDIDDDEFTS